MIAAVLFRRVLWTVVVVLLSAAAAGAQVRIVQTNSAGDNIHLIDPATNAIVGEVKGVPINHGAAALPDGSRFFFSSEAEQTLHVVDGKTLQTTRKIPLSGRPNNISISKDGARVYEYVSADCAFEPGSDDAETTCLAGLECWAPDLLAVLRGELGPIALTFGRARLWNALPARFAFDIFGELYRMSHPLRRPAEYLRTYQRLWAQARDVAPVFFRR